MASRVVRRKARKEEKKQRLKDARDAARQVGKASNTEMGPPASRRAHDDVEMSAPPSSPAWPEIKPEDSEDDVQFLSSFQQFWTFHIWESGKCICCSEEDHSERKIEELKEEEEEEEGKGYRL